jgi:hypothetical protein
MGNNDTTMRKRQEIYFEIFDGGDIVRLEPLEVIKYESDLDWDRNWIKTNVTVKGGKFYGQYSGDFMTVDFEKFKQELSRLYDNLKGTANFNDLEGFLELKITGDGIGHFKVDVKACDQPGVNESKLSFTIGFDQTELKELVNQLDRITKQFPISGDFKVKNE